MRGDGEAVHAVAVAEQRLQLAEVQAHAILAARDLGRVGAPAHDGADHDRVTLGFRRGRDDDPVAEMQPGVGGEPFVDRDASLCRQDRRGEDEQQERVLQRRADALQCAVSFSDSRVCASVYDGAL